jgi:hypothetical protein
MLKAQLGINLFVCTEAKAEAAVESVMRETTV